MYAVMELADRRKDEEKQRLEALFRSLITRVAQNRDRQAFAQLFDHFAPRLKSFMMRKNTSAELAEDLVQEAMIAVWTKAAMYEPSKGSVTTWVFEPSEAPEGEELLGRKQEDGLVARALQSIPEEQRQILVLSFVEEIPQSEIATRLSIPLGTVKSRMRLAYGHLRRILETGL
jgi:RNA polymerase sigma-70 factor (ECF subfamily)